MSSSKSEILSEQEYKLNFRLFKQYQRLKAFLEESICMKENIVENMIMEQEEVEEEEEEDEEREVENHKAIFSCCEKMDKRAAKIEDSILKTERERYNNIINYMKDNNIMQIYEKQMEKVIYKLEQQCSFTFQCQNVLIRKKIESFC